MEYQVKNLLGCASVPGELELPSSGSSSGSNERNGICKIPGFFLINWAISRWNKAQHVGKKTLLPEQSKHTLINLLSFWVDSRGQAGRQEKIPFSQLGFRLFGEVTASNHPPGHWNVTSNSLQVLATFYLLVWCHIMETIGTFSLLEIFSLRVDFLHFFFLHKLSSLVIIINYVV